MDDDTELENIKDIFNEKPDDRMERLEKKDLVLKLVKQMKQSYQEVLLLQYYHELEIAEIAEVLGETPDNIRHISMRAKKKMSKILKKYGVAFLLFM
mgnify:CR=1 FL=1